MSEILTVHQLTRKIKYVIESAVPYVWVKGEVTNCSRPTSGHVYFSLQDEEASLNCIWFKSNQRATEHFDPLTGEVFEAGPRPCLSQELTNGQRIICAGTLHLYQPHGKYQLVIDIAQYEGIGEFHLEFEALKTKLQQKGYFSPELKRTIKKDLKNIAVLTAPSGAAIQDFLKLAHERGSASSIHIYPVPVQGEGTVSAIVEAIEQVNSIPWADVLVIIRGGGSYQDLAIFNDERIVQAIHTSKVLTLCGIGHESDILLAELAADVRAATPSHAAQILWTERLYLIQKLQMVTTALLDYVHGYIKKNIDTILTLNKILTWFSPQQNLKYAKVHLDSLHQKLIIQSRNLLEKKSGHFVQQLHKLLRTPIEQKLCKNFYILAQTYKQLTTTISLITKDKNTQLILNTTQLRHMFYNNHQKTRYIYEKMHLTLLSLNPLLPLEKGYAIVLLENGKILRCTKEVQKGTNVMIQVSDGIIPACITKNKNNPI